MAINTIGTTLSLGNSLLGNSSGMFDSSVSSLIGTVLFWGLFFIISIGFVFAAFVFGYEQPWATFLRRQTTNLIDWICIRIWMPDKLGKEGLGKYNWLPWISAWIAIVLFGTILSELGMAFTTLLGILIITGVVIILFVAHPGIWPIKNLPKARFQPHIEEFLSGIASDMDMPGVRFRIDESEGMNVYGYECEYGGEMLRYAVFGWEIARLAQYSDTPEKPNTYVRGVLAFALAHELSHIRSGDVRAKHEAIRFLFPLQGINRTFFRAKAAMAGTNTSHSGIMGTDGRGHMGYNILSGIVSLIQLPYYAFFAIVLLPFHAFSHKMEIRADEQAFMALSSSETMKRNGIRPEEASSSFLLSLVESKSLVLRPSFFEAAMAVHRSPSERAKALGVTISSANP